MGASNGEFTKYPRTPHLFGSKGTDDDKHMGESDSIRFVSDPSLIVEEKIDGTNVGIHFASDGELVLQCRGHLISEGMHAQYDLFKRWVTVKRQILEERLSDQFILFGEWVYARHSIHYRSLAHYFFEFDIFDKKNGVFLGLERRAAILNNTKIATVPVLAIGSMSQKKLAKLIGPSRFEAHFDNPISKRRDHLMEGLYLRTEAGGVVTGRAKMVRPEFVERVKLSTHWQSQTMVANELAAGVDIWT